MKLFVAPQFDTTKRKGSEYLGPVHGHLMYLTDFPNKKPADILFLQSKELMFQMDGTLLFVPDIGPSQLLIYITQLISHPLPLSFQVCMMIF